MAVPTVSVCPIKHLYLMLAQGEIPTNSVAVLCTMNDVSSTKLKGLDYIHIPFADTLHTSSPDAFTVEQACQIRDYIDSHAGALHLYFCCDSGESRSTALAAATLRYLGMEDTPVWSNLHYHPNGLVYYRQSAAYGQQVTREQVEELCQYNNYLFTRQIRKQRRAAADPKE